MVSCMERRSKATLPHGVVQPSTSLMDSFVHREPRLATGVFKMKNKIDTRLKEEPSSHHNTAGTSSNRSGIVSWREPSDQLRPTQFRLLAWGVAFCWAVTGGLVLLYLLWDRIR